MKFVANNYSIVVVAQIHNPTILHPFFLASQKIVPNDWETAEGPVCTPAFSLVKYKSGVVFTTEATKFMVLDNAPEPTFRIRECASKYIEKLPHVHYSAVGININGYFECTDPDRWLLDRFLKAGPGNDSKTEPKGAGVKLIYHVGDSVICNLSMEGGTFKTPQGSEGPCVIVNGNYHTPIGATTCLSDALKAVNAAPERLAHFRELADILLPK